MGLFFPKSSSGTIVFANEEENVLYSAFSKLEDRQSANPLLDNPTEKNLSSFTQKFRSSLQILNPLLRPKYRLKPIKQGNYILVCLGMILYYWITSLRYSCSFCPGEYYEVFFHLWQRWNHHRASKSDTNTPILFDVTDNPCFTKCAQCGLEKIFEQYDCCPICSLSFGNMCLSDKGKQQIDSNFSAITYESRNWDAVFKEMVPL